MTVAWRPIHRLDAAPALAPLISIILTSAAVVFYVACLNFLYNNVPWWAHLRGFLLLLLILVAALWTGDRLWCATLGSLFAFRSQFIIFLSKLPFWAIAGGIGWEIGLLLAKRAGLLVVYDVPIAPAFVSGMGFGIVVEVVVVLLIGRWITKVRPEVPINVKETDHDKDRTT